MVGVTVAERLDENRSRVLRRLTQSVPETAIVFCRHWALGTKVKACGERLVLWRGYNCNVGDFSFALPDASLHQPLSVPEPTNGTGSAKRWRPCTPALAAGLHRVLKHMFPPVNDSLGFDRSDGGVCGGQSGNQ